MSAELWPRTIWAEGIWQSEALRPLEKLVALAFADFARDQETVWVIYRTLIARTGLSRKSVAQSIKALRDAGWLVMIDKGGQHRAPTYRLVVQQSPSETSGEVSAHHGTPLGSAQQSPRETAETVQQFLSGAPAVSVGDSTPVLTPEQRGGAFPSLDPEKPTNSLRCSKHSHIPDDEWVPSCRACQVRRERAEQADRERHAMAETKRVEEAELRKQCPDCDDLGRPEDPNTGRVLSRDRCTHSKIRRTHDGSTDDRLDRVVAAR